MKICTSCFERNEKREVPWGTSLWFIGEGHFELSISQVFIQATARLKQLHLDPPENECVNKFFHHNMFYTPSTEMRSKRLGNVRN